MIIGIDASRAVKKEKTGVEWYSYYLINALEKIIPPDWRVVCYVSEPSLFPLWKRGPTGDFQNNKRNSSLTGGEDSLFQRENYKILSWPPKHLWTQIRLSWEMLRSPPDALFIPSHVLPLIHPKKNIVTIHDVAFERYPEFYKPFDLWYQRWSTRFALRHAYKIIVPSEFTKKELVEIYHAPAQKIVVIPHGVTVSVIASPDDQSGRGDPGQQKNGIATLPAVARNDISKPYFLFIGRLEKKKNVERLLQAWEKTQLDNYELILVGNGHLENIPKNVRLFGWCSKNECFQLLSGATAYIMPSLYEGFGMTLLEAMSAGVPVIASDIPPHHEVAGDAALFIDPLSVESIAEGIKQMANDELTREELKKRGETRVKNFSWQKCAQRTWDAID